MLELDRERVVSFGRKRAQQGAGPVTVGMDVGLIYLVVQHKRHLRRASRRH